MSLLKMIMHPAVLGLVAGFTLGFAAHPALHRPKPTMGVLMTPEVVKAVEDWRRAQALIPRP